MAVSGHVRARPRHAAFANFTVIFLPGIFSAHWRRRYHCFIENTGQSVWLVFLCRKLLVKLRIKMPRHWCYVSCKEKVHLADVFVALFWPQLRTTFCLPLCTLSLGRLYWYLACIYYVVNLEVPCMQGRRTSATSRVCRDIIPFTGKSTWKERLV